MFVMCNVCFFFFQAEDGIRDLVRSRGLGDVYKRQGSATPVSLIGREILQYAKNINEAFEIAKKRKSFAVSYTHLTLPTSDLV